MARVLLLAWAVLLAGLADASFFHPPRRHKSSGSDSLAPADVGISSVRGRFMAVVDVDADRGLDLIVYEADSGASPDAAPTVLSVYLWSNAQFSYTLGGSTSVGAGVVSVSALDFNRDGVVDLLVQREATGPGGATTANELELSVLIGTGGGGDGGNKFFPADSVVSLPSSVGQVAVADVNADLWPDLVGRSGALGGARAWWVNEDGKSASVSADETSAASGSVASGDSGVVFADVDGDCVADLLVPVVTQDGKPGLEVWVNSLASDGEAAGGDDGDGEAAPTLTLHQVVELPQGHGQVTVADVDADGRMDLVVPVCFPRPDCAVTNEVHVLYNVAPACCNAYPGSARADGECMGKCGSGLCVAPPTFGFASQADDSGQRYRVVLPASAFGASTWLANSTMAGLQVRSGDYNLDGYPDLLAVVTADGTGRAVILTNVACDDTADDSDDDVEEPVGDGDDANALGCTVGAVDMLRRSFRIADQGVGALSEVRDVVAAAFVDIDQVGTLHIITARDPSLWNTGGGTENAPGLAAVFNDFDLDAYFIKAIGLNGVCPAWCDTGPKFPNPKPYGGVQHGATFQYSVVDLHRRRHHVTGAQLSQSSHMALQSPGVLFGLGRISNYVDYIAMGVPLATGKESGHFNTWPGVIPNSIVAATPYPQRTSAEWPIWMFISPSEYSAYVLAGIIVSMIVTAIPIAYCHWREQQEDNREAKVNSHAFTFSAL